jgi:uncharacterized damage-inducible protein DinB
MPDWNFLIRGFDYDVWANMRWHNCLLGKQFPSPDTEIFAHIFSATEIWVRRLNGESLTALPKVEPTEAEITRLHREWVEVLQEATDDRIVDFRRTNGESLSLRLSEIARHVINHATYHRGELRGLCKARNDDDFPETDYALFAFQNPVS